MTHFREPALERIAFVHQDVNLIEVLGGNHLMRFLKHLYHLVTDGKEGVNVVAWQRIEIVVDVLYAGVADAFETVEELRNTVIAQVKPSVLLHGFVVVDHAHAHNFFLSGFRPIFANVVDRVGSLAQLLDILVHQSVGDVQVTVACEVNHAAMGQGNVAVEQFKAFAGIFGSYHLVINDVAFVYLGLFLEVQVAMNQNEQHDHHDCSHGNRTTEVHQRGDDKAEREGSAGCDEPSAYHREYTRDAIDGTLASPGTVGQRRTHRYHEGHVGGGERKLQRRTNYDEQTR